MTPTWKPAAGSGAALIQELSVVLYVGGALIFVFVMALLLHAVFSPPRAIRSRRWLVGGGLVFPGTVLTALLFYSLAIGNALGDTHGQGALRFLLNCVSSVSKSLGLATAGNDAIRIEVNARQWWWQVKYITTTSEFELANELHLPVGRPVEVVLVTQDVIHSFWVPSLAGKVDMIPGHRNRLVLRSDEPGVHRGQCAEYCGAQHALMAFFVIVEPEAEFERWKDRQLLDAAEPAGETLSRGRAAFLRGGCGTCHTVRGTAAQGDLGPDLTHVGSRRSLGAGILDNHVGTLAGWIAGTQDLKPGSFMPDTREFDGEELRAIAAWLKSLE